MREIGDTVWSQYPDKYHLIKLNFDYSGNSEDNRPADIPATEKETIALDAQLLRPFTTVVLSINSLSGYSATVTSSDPTVATATCNYSNLTIKALKPGTTNLSVTANYSAYIYTMDITVVPVPVKDENVKLHETGLKINTTLGGANVPDDAEVTLEANSITEGEKFNKLQSAATNNVLGAYSIDLGVNGNAVHNEFGEIDITFPVPSDYTNPTIKVHHLHEADNGSIKAGDITSEIANVKDGEVTVTVSDLSTFALEEIPVVADDPSGSIDGDNNQNNNGDNVQNGDNQNGGNDSGSDATQKTDGNNSNKNNVSNDANYKGLAGTGDLLNGFGIMGAIVFALYACAALTIVIMRMRRGDMQVPVFATTFIDTYIKKDYPEE